MITRIKELILKKTFKRQGYKIKEFKNIPFLISFPRTGSHWLRIVIEKYSNRPLLTRSFYNHKNDNYLLYHTHDLNLDTKRKKIIYLYRYPTDVIYSQLNYYQQDINDLNQILFWTNQYAAHLAHWFFLESTATHKCFISYESMQKDLEIPFKKVVNFLDLNWNNNRLKKIADEITKEKVAKKTLHDNQVINNTQAYQTNKEIFKNQYNSLIIKAFESYSIQIFNDKDKLTSIFK